MEHEGEQCGPGLEVHVASQGADVIKEGSSCAQGMANLLVGGISQGQRGVQEKSQEVEAEQQGG